jgi:hypothetical protein
MTHTNLSSTRVLLGNTSDARNLLAILCMWIVKSIVAQFWVSLEIECGSNLRVTRIWVSLEIECRRIWLSPEIECLWIWTCTDMQIPLSRDIYWNISTVPLEFKELPSCIQQGHWMHKMKILTVLLYLNTRTNSHERVRCRGPSNSLCEVTWMSISSQRLLICM